MKEKKTMLVAVEDEKENSHIFNTLHLSGFGALTAFSGKEAISVVNKRRPHLALISREYSDMDYLSLMQGLRKWFDAPIIVLSPRQEERLVVEALDAGAYDYFVTPFGTAEHMARIRSALRQSSVRHDRRAADKGYSVGELSIDYSSRVVSLNGKRVHLTPIEFRILSLLTQNAGRVLTHEQIIDEIWGPYNSDNLVLRVNMANIRRKIEADPSTPKYILTESGVGYMALGRRATDRGTI